MPKTYSNWNDLLRKWASGESELRPQRSNWRYRVEDDILVWSEKKVNAKTGVETTVDHGVGYPVGGSCPRLLMYTVTHWRVRLSERTVMEEAGGIPVLPFELVSPFVDANRPDLISKDRGDHDFAVLDHIMSWVAARGVLDDGVQWRKYRVQGKHDSRELMIGFKTRRNRLEEGKLLTSGYGSKAVARFTDSSILLLGQTGRNEDIGWIRDAVYVAVSRQRGAGIIPDTIKLERLGEAGCSGHSVSGGEIEVFPTPIYVSQYLEETGSVNG